jgi:hypothetical protein
MAPSLASSRAPRTTCFRIWCATHQIDIVVNAAAEGIQDGIYFKQAYTFSVYLRAQYILII